jgi:hypothetical protein
VGLSNVSLEGVIRAKSAVEVVVGCASVKDHRAHEVTPGPLPEPLPPDYEGAGLQAVVPSLLAHVARPEASGLPEWFPDPVSAATQVVLLVLDGLGSEQLRARRQTTPVLSAAEGASITTVAPSTTACALTTLATGKVPAEHGVLGYRLALDGKVMNVLQWSIGGHDARVEVPAQVFQPLPSFPGAESLVPVVTRYDYGPTGFTAAHLGRVDLHRWHTSAGLVTGVRRLVCAGAPFVYAYYEGIDKVAHATGLGEHYDDELRAVDRLVGDVLDVLPAGAVLVVTADHGQVEVGSSIEVLGEEIMKDVTLISGEGRFRWLHVRSGAAVDVAAAANEIYGNQAWIRTREQVIEQGWFGGVPSPSVAARLGDVALVPFAPIAFLDPADTGELRLQARHGSLTPEEMLVPLLAWSDS